MQNFYKDKSKLFECNLVIEGAKLNETKARLLLEFPNDRKLIFNGDIDNNGKCKVLIPALNEMDECEGTATLEIIAEQTFFESWKDDFKLTQNKKVVVEVIEEKPIIVEDKKPVVSVITEKEPSNLDKFNKFLSENDYNLNSIITNKKLYLNTLKQYMIDENVGKNDIIELHEEIIKNRKNIL